MDKCIYQTTGNITCGNQAQNDTPIAETRYATIAQYEFDTKQFPKVVELFVDKQSQQLSYKKTLYK